MPRKRRIPADEDMPAFVTLDVPGVLLPYMPAARTPPNLRFAVSGNDWRTLRALFAFEDEPRSGESVLAGEVCHTYRIHTSRPKAGYAEWERFVTYRPTPEQPPVQVVWNNGLWRSYCVGREQRTNGGAV